MHELKWETIQGELEKYAIRNMHILSEPPHPMPQPIMNSSPGIEPWLMKTEPIFKDGKSLMRIYYKRN